MSNEKKNFRPMIIILMICSVIVLLMALWLGFGYALAQNNGNVTNTITGDIGTIFLVIIFFVGMIFTLRKKLWGLWLFGIVSVLMFVGLALPGMGVTMRPLSPAGFLGVATAILIYQQRDLLS